VREHRAFLTAVVVDREGMHIDVATARSEFYRAPAALPEVQTSLLRQDLYRRDFTINTLAIRLGPGEPELIDYFGGRRDLEERTLRVLHSLSLIDDPTRVLRAVRLEVRLGFRISPETLRLVQVALAEGVFERLSGARLRAELVELLEEPAAALRGLERLAELRLLSVLHPRLELDGRRRALLQETVAVHDWFRLTGLRAPRLAPGRLMLLALAAGLEDGDRARLAARLHLAGEDRRLLLESPARRGAARAALHAPGAAPRSVSEALAGLCGEELLLAMAEEDEDGRRWLRRELLEMRPLALRVRGRDLIARGVPPGPDVGRALRETRGARLDGRIGPEEELEHALGLWRSWRRDRAVPAAVEVEEGS
jgi:tRNA nucleotidyltransferase (CCA-adding enzyme)